ncbi:MAG: tetratricopeptide repeat protein [Bryobacteraceae bacterium]
MQELALNAGHYLAKALLGRIYVALQQPEKALPLLEAAVAARPNLTDARKALGQALAAQKSLPRL